MTVRHDPATTAMLVVLFWVGAAILVATCSHCHPERSEGSATQGRRGSFATLRMTAFAEVASAVATIASVASSRLGHPWSGLIGSPARPLLRNVFLFVWVFAPALFARPEGEA